MSIICKPLRIRILSLKGIKTIFFYISLRIYNLRSLFFWNIGTVCFPTSQRVRPFISIKENPRIWKTILYYIICHCIGASSYGLSDFLLLHKENKIVEFYLVWTRCLKNKQDIRESLISCVFFSMKKKTTIKGTTSSFDSWTDLRPNNEVEPAYTSSDNK